MARVPRESANINARERIDFVSYSVIGESPNFLDLGLSPANTEDNLKSVFLPATRVEGLTDNFNWLSSMHGCKGFTEV